MSTATFDCKVKIQYHRDRTSGGGRAKATIPVRIRREAAVEAGSFMEWREEAGKLVATPTLTPSLCSTAVYPGGRDQLYCLFPGVFWKKYDLQKGAELHWSLKGKEAVASMALPKRARRRLSAKDKNLTLSHTVWLLRHQQRYRVNIPTECLQALKLTAEHLVRWEEIEGGIRCTPVREEAMDTTRIEIRKAGNQVEIPKFLCDTYDLFGQRCTWTLQKGELFGTIACRLLGAITVSGRPEGANHISPG